MQVSLRKLKRYRLDIIYVIDSFEFQETNVPFSLNTNNKPISRKLEKTIPLIKTFSYKISQWLLSISMELTCHFIYRPRR